MTNAFASTVWEELDKTVELFARPRDVELCRERYRHSVVQLQAAEGPLLVKTKQGGVMGDPFVVKSFSGSFQRPVGEWCAADRGGGKLHSSLGSVWADLSLCKYADDLLKFIVAEYNMSMVKFLGAIKEDDDVLDCCLLPFGYQQNRSNRSN